MTGMDFWTLLDLRLRHALRGKDDRKGDTEWIRVPVEGGVRVLNVKAITSSELLENVEAWVKGDVS